jgi:hypothetical protein
MDHHHLAPVHAGAGGDEAVGEEQEIEGETTIVADRGGVVVVAGRGRKGMKSVHTARSFAWRHGVVEADIVVAEEKPRPVDGAGGVEEAVAGDQEAGRHAGRRGDLLGHS